MYGSKTASGAGIWQSDLYTSGPSRGCSANGNTGILVTREAHALYVVLSEKSAEQGGWNPYAMHFVDRFSRWAGQYVDLSALDLRGALLRSLEQISHGLFSLGTHFLSNIVAFFAEAVIAFFTLFFLFREGESLKLQLAAFLPLRADQFERLFTGVSNSIVANVVRLPRGGRLAGNPDELGILGAWPALSCPMGIGNSALLFASVRWLICGVGTHYDVPFHFRTLGKGFDLTILERSGSVAN